MTTPASTLAADQPSMQVLVTGDKLTLYDIYEATKTSALHEWQDKVGTSREGGAVQIANILSVLLERPPTPAITTFAEMRTPPSTLYPFWEAFPEDKESPKNDRTWRISSILKSLHPLPPETSSSPDPQHASHNVGDAKPPNAEITETESLIAPDLIVIDDEGAFFRSDPTCWPSTISDTTNLDAAILLKTCAPFYGALWDGLKGFANLTIVLNIDDLRSIGANLSKGLSWDRTIDELLEEFRSGQTSLAIMPYAQRVFVIFPYCAVAQFEKDASGTTYLEHFIYHPSEVEGRFLERFPGHTFGCGTLVTSAIAYSSLCQNGDVNQSLFLSIASALEAARELHKYGGGRYKGFQSGYVIDAADTQRAIMAPLIAGWLLRVKALQSASDVASLLSALTEQIAEQDPASPDLANEQLHSQVLLELFYEEERPDLAHTSFRCIKRRPIVDLESPGVSTHVIRDTLLHEANTVEALAHWIVDFGHRSALEGVPYGAFGRYVSVHRTEVEQLNELRAVLANYVANPADTRPFCIGVFGPPGSGKSFAINELATELLGERARKLRFDVSQFGDDIDSMHRAFDAIRDETINEFLPCVVWDEFDSDNLRWLKAFLGPMQDKELTVAGHGYPFGKAIFAFAGGTAHSFDEFESMALEQKAAKAPDFVSRLRAYVDIQGINPLREEGISEGFDPYVIRRAILLRSYIERYHEHLIDSSGFASVKNGVVYGLSAGLSSYKHGARSLEQIIAASALAGEPRFRSFHLPSDSQLKIHVEPASLQSICNCGEKRKEATDVVVRRIGVAFPALAFEPLGHPEKARLRFYARICQAIAHRANELSVDPSVIATRYLEINNTELAKVVDLSPRTGMLVEILQSPGVFA